MTLAYHVPALSAGNYLRIYPYTSFGFIQPDLFTFPHPAHSPRFPWPAISDFPHLDHVHQVCTGSYAVGCMTVCTMTVFIHSASHCILTGASMTHMTSLTDILLVSFISNLVLTFWLTSNGQDDITFIGCQSMRVEVYSIGMAYSTLAHA